MRNILPTLSAIRRTANQLDLRSMSELRSRLLPEAIPQITAAGPAFGVDAARVNRSAPVVATGRGLFPVGMALVGLCGTTALAFVASRAAEPLVLTIMAALATIGVFFLFALAAHHVRFGQASTEGDLLRCIIDADPCGVLVTDSAGRAITHNRAFAALVGSNALGEINTLEALLTPEPAGAETLFRLSRAAERGESASEELRLTGRPGVSARWLRVSSMPVAVPTPNSGPTAAAGSNVRLWRVEDVTTDRLRQLDAVRVLETRLAHYAGAPIGLLSVTKDGHVATLNDRLADWLGYTDQALPRDFKLSDLVADGGAHLVTSLTETDAHTPSQLDLDLICEGGRRWPATLLVLPEADRISIAVLERIEEETGGTAMSATQTRFSRFFQSAPFGIAAVDEAGRIVSANAAFARLLLDGTAQRGGNLVDVLGKADPEISHKVASVLEAARGGKASIPPFDITLGGKGRELTRRVYTTSLARSGSAREVAILYVIDATEAKALEQKVAQAQKMEAVGTLAGGIAHDFNNVLTAIIGFSDLLLQTHKPGNASYAHILSIKSSANRAAGLVRQLLAFSRRQTMQPKVLQIGDLLTDWSMLMNRLLGEKIELKIVSGRDLWHIKADPSELERIIINLAVNARDAMLPKSGRLTIRTRNITERDSQKLAAHGVSRGEYMMIEVEDTGCGMTPEIMAKIFDPFFTTKAVGKGTGLGLASVYGIVQQTGGYIVPESTPGEGTTFRLYLPRHHLEPEEEVEPAPSAKKPRARDLTGTGRVLLVEDEDAVRRFAVAALKSKGYEVLQAGDGVEAIEVFKAHDNKVDIVVSDVIMPEMDGPTLMKELRKIDPKLKFIFVSGYPDDAFKNNLDADAEYTFLPKPYNLAQLAAQVKEQLES